jgi:hypothetical protein
MVRWQTACPIYVITSVKVKGNWDCPENRFSIMALAPGDDRYMPKIGVK